MKLINQMDCYTACGLKIKKDLYDGNAVVMFAYVFGRTVRRW